MSSSDQRSDLDRQLSRLCEWAAFNEMRVVRTESEVASPMSGERRKLGRRLADPSVRTVVVERRDRLGCMDTELVESALAAHGRSLVVVDTETDDDLVRDRRGKKFRRSVASMPTAEFRDRLAAMAHNAGIAIIAVDPAYTTQWGRKHWLAHLQESRRTLCSDHHAAAVVIGRCALGLTAKRRSTARDGHHQHPTEDGAAATKLSQMVKCLQAKPTTPEHDAEEAREPVKRKTSRHGMPGTHRHPAEHAETPTRRPAQGTANRSRRPPSRQRKPTATN